MAGARSGRGPAGRAASGNIVVELALVLPLFLLIVAGIIDLGTLYWEKQILTNATAEGARMAARTATGGVADQTSSQIRQIVQDYLNRFHLQDAGGRAIVLTQGGNFNYQWNTALTPVQLSVGVNHIPVQLLLLPNIQSLFGGGLSGTINLRAQTTMAAEWTTPPGP